MRPFFIFFPFFFDKKRENFFFAFLPACLTAAIVSATSTWGSGISGGFGVSYSRANCGTSGETGWCVGGFGVRSSNSMFRFFCRGDGEFFFIRRRYMFWLPYVMWSLWTCCEPVGPPSWECIVMLLCWPFESLPFFSDSNCGEWVLFVVNFRIKIFQFLF